MQALWHPNLMCRGSLGVQKVGSNRELLKEVWAFSSNQKLEGLKKRKFKLSEPAKISLLTVSAFKIHSNRSLVSVAPNLNLPSSSKTSISTRFKNRFCQIPWPTETVQEPQDSHLNLSSDQKKHFILPWSQNGRNLLLGNFWTRQFQFPPC